MASKKDHLPMQQASRVVNHFVVETVVDVVEVVVVVFLVAILRQVATATIRVARVFRARSETKTSALTAAGQAASA